MKVSKHALVMALGSIALVAPGAVRADSVVQVTFTDLTFIGAVACGPSANVECMETVTGSFLWDNTMGAAVANSEHVTSNGPLDAFSFTSATIGPLPPPPPDIECSAWTNAAGDVINLCLYLAALSVAPGNYALVSAADTAFQSSADLACQASSTICQSDFLGFALATSGTVTASSETVPEPAVPALLVIGILGLVATRRCMKQRCGRAPLISCFD